MSGLRAAAAQFLKYGGLALAALVLAAATARARDSFTPPSPSAVREALNESWGRELASRLDRPPAPAAVSTWQNASASGQSLLADVPGGGVESWIRVPAPAQRSWHAAIHDPVRDRMVVLGGEDWWAGIGYGDVWTLSFDGDPAWHDLDPPGTGPGILAGHSAAYDPAADRIVVFGGGSDLWALSLSGSTWTHLAAAGTPPDVRRGHSAIVDAARGRMIVYGGWNGGPLDDVWELTLGETPTWTQLDPAGPIPPGRDHHSVILDPTGDRMIVYGGWNDRDDVWQLSLDGASEWTQLAPAGPAPAGRWAHSAVLDAANQRMIVFGGESSGATFDIWAMSLDAAPAWTALAPAGPLPIERLGHVAVFDPVRGRMIAFGGEDGNDLPLRDVWSLALNESPTWEELAPTGSAPGGRLSPTAILDPTRDRIVIFGGESGGYRNDGGAANPATNAVNVLPLGDEHSWTVASPGGDLPSARLDHVAIHDPPRDRMIVFGGAAARWAGGSNDLWSLSLGDLTWTALAPAGTPPGPLRGHTAIYDPLRDRMIVFGGSATASGAGNEVWALSLDGEPTWAQLLPAGPAPAARRGHTAVYDSEGDRMVILGGRSSSGTALDDVWSLALGGAPEWTPWAPAGMPPAPRWGHSAIYDAEHDRLVIHGGLTNEGTSSEVWTLTLGESPEWSAVEPAETPPPRSEHVAIQDLSRERMVVFGGWDGEFVLRNDVWALRWASPLALAVPESPSGFTLLGARPNPFRAGGRIGFVLPRSADVTLEVFDVRGRRVATLARGPQPAGHHEIAWTANGTPAGVYFLSLRSGAVAEWRRLVLVR